MREANQGQMSVEGFLEEHLDDREKSWDYVTADTKYFTHCYHAYPAMMIPQVARRLIKEYGPAGGHRILFDPFCGSGTTLVEGILCGLRVVGTDINPLAKMIAEAKCSPLYTNKLRRLITDFHKFVSEVSSKQIRIPSPSFKNIDFWFNEEEIFKLASIRIFIDDIPTDNERNFFRIAFSETVRESSLTRSGEFKLFRKPESERNNFKPAVYEIMQRKLERNFRGVSAYVNEIKKRGLSPKFKVYDFNTVEGIPEEIIKPNSVDIIVTSPPYGDSSTTVAYGQFSRLSSQWLGVDDAFKIDKMLMGGTRLSEIPEFEISQLDAALKYI